MLNFKNINLIFLVILTMLLIVGIVMRVPFQIYIVTALFYLIILGYGSAVLSAQFFMPVKCKGESTSGAIAITFDDGPVSDKTERIMDILASRKIPACFFCIGHRVNDFPGIVRKIHDAGHLVGNHSYWHRNTFDLQSAKAVLDELVRTDDVIERSIGLRPNFFRPPFGVTNPMVAKAVKSLGHQTIGWSLRSFDTMAHDRAALLTRITKTLKSGDVVLFHDYCDITIEVLPAFFDHVASTGLKIVRLDQLLNERGYV